MILQMPIFVTLEQGRLSYYSKGKLENKEQDT